MNKKAKEWVSTVALFMGISFDELLVKTAPNVCIKHLLCWYLSEEGYSVKCIAEVFGLHRTTVYYALNHAEDMMTSRDNFHRSIRWDVDSAVKAVREGSG